MDNNTPERVIPQAPDLEQSILAEIMLDPPRYLDLCLTSNITADHFYIPKHRIIYATLVRRHSANEALDATSVINDIIQRGNFEKIGGHPGFMDVLAASCTTASLKAHIADLNAIYTRRQLVLKCQEITEAAMEGEVDAEKLLDNAESSILAIRQCSEADVETSFQKALSSALTRIERMITNKGMPDGVCTGYYWLDSITSGLHPGEFFVIAARPSMGKTALLLNMMENIVAEDNQAVLLFSMEMSAVDIAERMFLTRSGVSKRTICEKRGAVPKGGMNEMKKAIGWLKSRKIYLKDTASLSINALCAYARRMKRNHPNICCIGIDYLQLMHANSEQSKFSREREVSEISARLKALAKELNIPIICLSQLNRAVESRTGKDRGVPLMSDLRDSGSIEQDADLIGLLYRPAYYLQDGDPKKHELANQAFLNIAKNRNGQTRNLELYFEPSIMKFSATPPVTPINQPAA